MNQQPQQQQQSPASGQKKSISPGLIIVLVLVGLLLIGGIGGYLVYAKIKSAVNTSADANKSTTTATTTTPTTNSTSTSTTTEDVYANAKDNTPTGDLAIQINTEFKPLFAKLFGNVKLETWASTTDENTNFSYAAQKAITVNDYAALEKAVVAKGYVKSGNANTSDGFMFSGEKDGVIVTIQFSTSQPNEIILGAEKPS